jgi:mannose-6-phosphate isomerase-like protein (cupin superfamily)
MKVVHATPTQSVAEHLSVQRLTDALGACNLRANVWTLAEGSMTRHLHREQEELYLVLDGTAEIVVNDAIFRLGERDALAVPTGAWHQVRNAGLGPLTFLVVASPAVQGDAELAVAQSASMTIASSGQASWAR